GDDDDAGPLAAALLEEVDELVAADRRHHQVENDDGVVGLVHLVDRLGAISGDVDAEAGALHDLGNERTNSRLVVHHQHTSLRLREHTGRDAKKMPGTTMLAAMANDMHRLARRAALGIPTDCGICNSRDRLPGEG